jgi:hypothetical protein
MPSTKLYRINNPPAVVTVRFLDGDKGDPYDMDKVIVGLVETNNADHERERARQARKQAS